MRLLTTGRYFGNMNLGALRVTNKEAGYGGQGGTRDQLHGGTVQRCKTMEASPFRQEQLHPLAYMEVHFLIAFENIKI